MEKHEPSEGILEGEEIHPVDGHMSRIAHADPVVF